MRSAVISTFEVVLLSSITRRCENRGKIGQEQIHEGNASLNARTSNRCGLACGRNVTSLRQSCSRQQQKHMARACHSKRFPFFFPPAIHRSADTHVDS